MSFFNIIDPNKKDLIEKEYLELKKNIRDNLLSERTGEQQLQTDLSKFYRPITGTQKATAREITEGLKPIREGIEKLPQAMQPLGEAPPPYIDIKAEEYLEDPNSDKKFGIYVEEGDYKIGNKKATIFNNNIEIEGEIFKGTPGLITYVKKPKTKTFY